MTCSDDSFIARWINHMEGASQLLEFRGPDQLKRQEGLHLFTNLRAQIVCTAPLSIEYIKILTTLLHCLEHQQNIPRKIQLSHNDTAHGRCKAIQNPR